MGQIDSTAKNLPERFCATLPWPSLEKVGIPEESITEENLPLPLAPNGGHRWNL